MNLADSIEHTRLAATTRERDVRQICSEALEYGFAGVCVAPLYVPLAAELVDGSAVRVVTVVGFPLGAGSACSDVAEAAECFQQGAKELDMVVPIGLALDGDWAAVTRRVQRVREAVPEAVLKVILETGYFPGPELEQVARAAIDAGADYLKTSTGFGGSGASVEDVRRLSTVAATAERRVLVKASGGIRDVQSARQLLEAGAVRLGTSRGDVIAEQAGCPRVRSKVLTGVG